MIRKLVTVFAVLAVSACASMNVDPQADFGAPPPDDYAQIVRDTISAQLKDPRSAQFEISDPAKGYVKGNGIQPTTYGYLVIAKVNAKNGYGGYTGFKDWHLFFDGREVENLYDPEYLGKSRIHFLHDR